MFTPNERRLPPAVAGKVEAVETYVRLYPQDTVENLRSGRPDEWGDLALRAAALALTRCGHDKYEVRETLVGMLI